MVRRADLGTLIPLGRGGQGSVYRIPDYEIAGKRGFVYKEYKKSVRQERGFSMVPPLQALIDYPSMHEDWVKKRFYRWTTMPRQMVVNGKGAAVGYVMSEINDKYRGDDGRTPTEIISLLQPRPEIENVLGFAPTPKEVSNLMLNLILVLEFMHSRDVIVGDLSARNIVFTNPKRVPPGSALGPMQVKLLDADSFRIKRETAVVQQLNTPNYETPELLIKKTRLQEMKRRGGDPIEILSLESELVHLHASSDVFKLGLILLRLWDRTHSAYCVQDSQVARDRIEKMFGQRKASAIRQMTDALPDDRPTMSEVLKEFTTH